MDEEEYDSDDTAEVETENEETEQDQDVLDEMPSEETTETKPVAKEKKVSTKKKAAPKKAAKPVKKAKKPEKAAKKPAKKAAKPKPKKESKPARDDARGVAYASGGKLTTDKVRILRATRKGRRTTMAEIKIGCGIAEDAKYSGGFLKAVHSLQEEKMLKVDKEQEDRAHYYVITEKGVKALESAEKAFKEKKTAA